MARAGDIAWDPDGVGIGLGSTILAILDPADLTDAAAWELDVEHYNAADGPFSVLDGLHGLAPIDDLIVQMGPHNHCVSLPKPPPAGLGSLLRVSMQPASMDSCLEWFTIDLSVTPEGNIRAITYDFWEP